MHFTILKTTPKTQEISLEEALRRWTEQSQTAHIAYRTRGGAWAVLTFTEESHERDRVYGFAYVSKLLTGRPLLRGDLYFKGNSLGEALCNMLNTENSGRSDLLLFQTWQEFVKEMVDRMDKCEGEN